MLHPKLVRQIRKILRDSMKPTQRPTLEQQLKNAFGIAISQEGQWQHIIRQLEKLTASLGENSPPEDIYIHFAPCDTGFHVLIKGTPFQAIQFTYVCRAAKVLVTIAPGETPKIHKVIA